MLTVSWCEKAWLAGMLLGGGPLGTGRSLRTLNKEDPTVCLVQRNHPDPSGPSGPSGPSAPPSGEARGTGWKDRMARASRNFNSNSNSLRIGKLQSWVSGILTGAVHFSWGFLLISLSDFSTGRRSEHKRDKTSQAKAERGGRGRASWTMVDQTGNERAKLQGRQGSAVDQWADSSSLSWPRSGLRPGPGTPHGGSSTVGVPDCLGGGFGPMRECQRTSSHWSSCVTQDQYELQHHYTAT